MVSGLGFLDRRGVEHWSSVECWGAGVLGPGKTLVGFRFGQVGGCLSQAVSFAFLKVSPKTAAPVQFANCQPGAVPQYGSSRHCPPGGGGGGSQGALENVHRLHQRPFHGVACRVLGFRLAFGVLFGSGLSVWKNATLLSVISLCCRRPPARQNLLGENAPCPPTNRKKSLLQELPIAVTNNPYPSCPPPWFWGFVWGCREIASLSPFFSLSFLFLSGCRVVLFGTMLRQQLSPVPCLPSSAAHLHEQNAVFTRAEGGVITV